MFLSVFDLFKIGVGPSSSHTMGPMVAARRFVGENLAGLDGRSGRLSVALHGSLAYSRRSRRSRGRTSAARLAGRPRATPTA